MEVRVRTLDGKRTVLVDVADGDCPGRPCLVVASRGRRALCFTRLDSGCPVHSRCPVCRGESVRMPGEPCGRRGCCGVLEERAP